MFATHEYVFKPLRAQRSVHRGRTRCRALHTLKAQSEPGQGTYRLLSRTRAPLLDESGGLPSAHFTRRGTTHALPEDQHRSPSRGGLASRTRPSPSFTPALCRSFGSSLGVVPHDPVSATSGMRNLEQLGSDVLVTFRRCPELHHQQHRLTSTLRLSIPGPASRQTHGPRLSWHAGSQKGSHRGETDFQTRVAHTQRLKPASRSFILS